MSEHLAEDQRCAVEGCENTRSQGRFVGDFCAACDAALRSGNFEFGTSAPFSLQQEVNRLQRALAFWLPKMPSSVPMCERYGERIGNDSFLLAGYNGPDEKSAEELGWINLQ